MPFMSGFPCCDRGIVRIPTCRGGESTKYGAAVQITHNISQFQRLSRPSFTPIHRGRRTDSAKKRANKKAVEDGLLSLVVVWEISVRASANSIRPRGAAPSLPRTAA